MKVNGKVEELEQKERKSNGDALTFKAGVTLSEKDIKDAIKSGNMKIEPFSSDHLGPASLDMAVSDNFARLKSDTKSIDVNTETNLEEMYYKTTEDPILINQGEHLLMESVEYLKLPLDIVGLIALRSTFSRLGISTPPTTIDPGFEGKIIFHLIGSSFPIKLRARTLVFKVIFFKCNSTRKYDGRYDKQTGVVIPRIPIV